MARLTALLALAVLALTGCPSNGGGNDGGNNGDGGNQQGDGGNDGGNNQSDGGDSGTVVSDGGTLPRLFVADNGSGGGVKVWNAVNTLTVDVAPSATLSAADQGLGLAAYQDHLFVATDSATAPLDIYANASTLTTNATPLASVGTAAFNNSSMTVVYQMDVDSTGALWISDDSNIGSIRLFPNATALTSTSMPSQVLTHPYDMLVAFAYVSSADRLFAGQGSGGGVPAWNSAKTPADAGSPDFTLDTEDAYYLATTANRLFAARTSAEVRVWSNPGTLSAPATANAVLTMGLGDVRNLYVKNNVLVVTVSEPFNSVSKVLLYKGANSISADRSPDQTITHAQLVDPIKSVLGTDGTLYVLDADGVLVFKNAADAPSFATELKSTLSFPSDILLLE
jgi:hypothetical protein